MHAEIYFYIIRLKRDGRFCEIYFLLVTHKIFNLNEVIQSSNYKLF